ncbi:CmcJ/NvfI family oxidoreductase [Ilumatobacter nonamiensis]|uniref:CmcJ/NvfI family oxidoreductase n=1 Tax=Ilumatobacter nonamiensis TaxID=467093 RepID=UPI00034D8130|nr:CmcJ/NvfI family oxidoreductase [Ilumatobacter nonamiensis]
MVDAVQTTSGVFCRATLNFAARGSEFTAEPVTLDILDGRSAELPGWTECGFELVSHPSSTSSWDDDDLVAVHHREMEDLARSMTGCDVALVSNHIKRGPEHAQRHQDLAPISFVHSDFAVGYDQQVRRSYVDPGPDRPGPTRALERNGITAADVLSAPRLVILQFWRNLGPAKMDNPLAFCDARTVTPDDTRPIPVSDYAGSGIDFNALAVLAPTAASPYRWYAFPELQVDEVVAFRTYDTDLVDRGESWFTPHSAFRDPDVEVGRPARSSIELRAICLFT